MDITIKILFGLLFIYLTILFYLLYRKSMYSFTPSGTGIFCIMVTISCLIIKFILPEDNYYLQILAIFIICTTVFLVSFFFLLPAEIKKEIIKDKLKDKFLKEMMNAKST